MSKDELGRKQIKSSGRRHPRVETSLEVEYRLTHNAFVDYTRNLSQSGVFIESERPLPIGSQLHLTFALPGGPRVKTEGQVVRIIWGGRAEGLSITPGMGIEFIRIADKDRRAIKELVARG